MIIGGSNELRGMERKAPKSTQLDDLTWKMLSLNEKRNKSVSLFWVIFSGRVGRELCKGSLVAFV